MCAGGVRFSRAVADPGEPFGTTFDTLGTVWAPGEDRRLRAGERRHRALFCPAAWGIGHDAVAGRRSQVAGRGSLTSHSATKSERTTAATAAVVSFRSVSAFSTAIAFPMPARAVTRGQSFAKMSEPATDMATKTPAEVTIVITSAMAATSG